MREIKFDYIFRDKVSGNIKHMLLKLDAIENGGISGFTYVFNDIIAKRQYTGLKDKNGVEVYDFDIVKGLGLIAKITWVEEECCFMLSSKTGGAFINQEYLDNFEVIGNIYENTELLEQK